MSIETPRLRTAAIPAPSSQWRRDAGGAPLLAVRDLRVHFRTPQGPARAVDGLSFDVAPGEIVGLVGESGCGKSATALAVMRLLPRRGVELGGQIDWAGRDLLALPAAAMRRIRGREMAMVFQDPLTSLNPVFPVGDQLGEMFTRHLGLTRRQAAAAVVDALARVGLQPSPDNRQPSTVGHRPSTVNRQPSTDISRAYPGQLSGGMRQRVMIAMAMAASPKLLIADEPTTALDVTTQAQVLRLIDDLRRQTGAATLLITHDLGVVAELCERVVVLYAGRAAEIAPVARLFAAPQHPYTEGLLRAVRRLDEGRVEAAIPGAVSPATNYPPGCRFHPRCPYAMDVCRREHPPLFEVGETRAACWLRAPTA
jgi:oligopeptide/dipeptide ABC transporter ATP-binding protein